MGSLTSVQQSILIGSLLGDGSLRRQGNRLNALLEVNHSIKYQEYVDWKWQNLKEYVLSPPKSRRGKGARIAYRFTTRSLPIFTDYYEQFYKLGIKEIPLNLVLDPLSLAVWFMDDGSRSRSAFYLNTQQFSLKEQFILQQILRDRFDIESTLNKDKNYYRIRVSTKSSELMSKLVDPYVVPCLRYKLINDPVTTELKNEILI